MANVLPEVRPAVESMPHEGFVMQTGGSARRSTIKNNGLDTYYVTGVPGHTQRERDDQRDGGLQPHAHGCRRD